MTKHPSFEFDRRRFLGLAAGGRGERGGARRSPPSHEPAASAAQDRHDRRRPRRRGARHALRQAGPPGDVLLPASRELKDLVAAAGPTAQAGTIEQAVKFGDVVLLVVPYTAVEEIGKDYGKALAAKPLVIDVSNPIARRDGDAIVSRVAEQGGAGLATAKSCRARISCAPSTRSTFASCPRMRIGRASRSACRSPATTRPRSRSRRELIKEIGFEPVLVGGLAMGKYLVPGTPLAGEHTPGRDPADRRDAQVSGAPLQAARVQFSSDSSGMSEKSCELAVAIWRSRPRPPRGAGGVRSHRNYTST